MQISSEIALLAQIMMRQKNRNLASFTLLLCSESAPASVEEIEREVLLDSMLKEDIEALTSIKRQRTFSEKWKNLEVEKRYKCIEQAFIEAKKKTQYQPKMESYNGLAQLIKYGYFDTIITTNIDTCLEDALINTGINFSDWRVLINGRDSLEIISQELKHPTPRIKIIKLYGELNSRKFAFDLKETKEFIEKIKPVIQNYLNGSVLMVGESTIDKEVSSCIPSASVSDKFYYVNVSQPQDNSKIREVLLELENHTIIWGEQANFSSFFQILSQKLIDFEQISELGIDINQKSDEKVFTALQSEEPLIELLEEDDDTSTATTTAGEPLENQDLLLDVIEPTTFYIRYDQRLTFAVQGKLNYESGPGEILDIDTEDLNSELMDMGQDLANSHRLQEQGKEGRDSWRRKVQRQGKRLFKDLLADKSNLMEKWGKAQQAVQSEYLNLCFIGPRNYLGMPYELLYGADPWAVRYPISRRVTDVDVSTKTQSFGTLVSDLVRNQESLKVLLIASNTGGINPDTEIKVLAEKIQQKADVIRLKVQIELVPTESASIQKVEQLLKQCSYHIIHYAGHSYFDQATGEGSGLIFWEHPENRGSKQRLTARALSQLLRDSQTILFYLSSCVGAAVGGEHLLRGNDYLGIMDAIIQAGIPTVLGYRWYVTDSGARQFATKFYESLLETQSPNRAALYARQDIYRRNAMDETWISPILVDQNL
ncbi:CHAT domain-containing protein [Nostoc sp. DedQUE07]|uniref:CHAT domain-containing protein n=1 Tax=Nostoc sp. DedQUE07 TaxID=3075392 RepID=UPI00391D5C07